MKRYDKIMMLLYTFVVLTEGKKINENINFEELRERSLKEIQIWGGNQKGDESRINSKTLKLKEK